MRRGRKALGHEESVESLIKFKMHTILQVPRLQVSEVLYNNKIALTLSQGQKFGLLL